MSRRPRPLDPLEQQLLEELLERALPPHHALFRTARAWYVYRWDEAESRFRPLLNGSSPAALLEALAAGVVTG